MTLPSRIAAGLGHFYPLKSGCGSFANSWLFRHLDPDGGPDGIAHVTGGRALVPGGDYVGRAMRYVGDLDPKVSWIVDQVVAPGDIALDIGANLGLVSLRLALRAGQTGHVHAFEPQPRLHPYFGKTIEMNPDACITLHKIALGTESSTLEMAVPKHNAGAASLVTPANSAQQQDMQFINVPVRPLTDYAAEIGLDRVDFIKMDVEGFEANVIAGGLELLKRTRPKVILLEENDIDPQTGLSPALAALQGLDYSLFALPRRMFSVALVPLSENRVAHDYVAVSASAPDPIWRALGV